FATWPHLSGAPSAPLLVRSSQHPHLIGKPMLWSIVRSSETAPPRPSSPGVPGPVLQADAITSFSAPKVLSNSSHTRPASARASQFAFVRTAVTAPSSTVRVTVVLLLLISISSAARWAAVVSRGLQIPDRLPEE